MGRLITSLLSGGHSESGGRTGLKDGEDELDAFYRSEKLLKSPSGTSFKSKSVSSQLLANAVNTSGSGVSMKVNRDETARIEYEAKRSYAHRLLKAKKGVDISEADFTRYELKKQRRFYRKELERMEYEKDNSDDERLIENFKKRRNTFEAHAQEVEAQLLAAEQRDAMIRREIAAVRYELEHPPLSGAQLVARVLADKSSKSAKWVRGTLSTSFNSAKTAAAGLSYGKKNAHKLPPFIKEENDRIVEEIIAEFQERLEKRIKANERGVKYLKRADEFENQYFNADDLSLAARSGNYEVVLQILLHPVHSLEVDALNTDGVTATYCTLMMIMKDEILDAQFTLFEKDSFIRRTGRALWQALRRSEQPAKTSLITVLRILIYSGEDRNKVVFYAHYCCTVPLARHMICCSV